MGQTCMERFAPSRIMVWWLGTIRLYLIAYGRNGCDDDCRFLYGSVPYSMYRFAAYRVRFVGSYGNLFLRRSYCCSDIRWQYTDADVHGKESVQACKVSPYPSSPLTLHLSYSHPVPYMSIHPPDNIFARKAMWPEGVLKFQIELLSYDSGYYIAWAAVVTEFAKTDALPGSEIKSSVGYGDSQ
jgi:hypothetical protein